MQIQHVNAKNFLGLHSMSIDIPGGLTIVAGPNGAGKSSLLESIRFGLRGERIRGVKNKSDFANLTTQGAKDGAVTVTLDGVNYKRSLKTGDVSINVPLPDVAEYVLDAQRFAQLPDDARRKFLFDLMEVETSHTAVAAMLKKADVRQDVIDTVLPLLRGGFAGAEQFADKRATEARGAWKGVTGETYGDKKADGWEPKAESATVTGAETNEELEAQAARVAELEQYLQRATKELGAAEARAAASNNPELATARTQIDPWKATLARGLARQIELNAEIEQLEKKAKESGGVYQPCPCCGESLLIEGGILKKAEAPNGDQAQASANLLDARDELAKLQEPIERTRRNIAKAERIVADADATAGDPGQLAADVKKAEADLGRARLARGTLDIRKKEREQFDSKAKEAAKHHADVQAWKLAADQLSPSGIPSTLLAQALKPINVQLGAASDITEWPRVEIHADMSITYGRIPYTQCSKSERWRCDAAIADALARISGIKILLLDEFDILDLPGRAAAIDWLQSIAPQYDTLIVGATLKAPPKIDGVHTVWLDDAMTGRRAA
jgi:hypothetical protein